MRAERDERLVEPVAEEGAIGEARQIVVEGLVGELLFEPVALGDVACVQNDAADVAVGPQVADVGFELAPLAELVLEPEHDLVCLAVGAGLLECLPVFGVHEADEPGAEHLRLGPSQHLRDRAADVAAAGLPEGRDEVGRGHHEAAEMRRLTSSCMHQAPAEQQ